MSSQQRKPDWLVEDDKDWQPLGDAKAIVCETHPSLELLLTCLRKGAYCLCIEIRGAMRETCQQSQKDERLFCHVTPCGRTLADFRCGGSS